MLKSIGGMVMGGSGDSGATTPTKPPSLADVVKKATSGASKTTGGDAEDGLVMETKLKIIEILQVREG